LLFNIIIFANPILSSAIQTVERELEEKEQKKVAKMRGNMTNVWSKTEEAPESFAARAKHAYQTWYRNPGSTGFVHSMGSIRALSAASAAKFNIAPVRWQHPSHVAIVPFESKGKTEGNDWDTACGNFKT
jgi:hypothetical protein